MKLKLVVASMSLLGLVMSPVAFAHTTHKAKTHHHHQNKKHHAKHHRHHAMRAQKQDFVPPARPEPVTASNFQNETLTAMNQNTNRGMPEPEWFNRIGIGGGINVDIGKLGARGNNFTGVNTQRLSINDAYINLTGKINDYAKVFASIDYSNPSEGNPAVQGQLGNAYRSARYAHVYDTNELNLEQAFVTLSNYSNFPFFIQIGKHFADFGEYEIHPQTRSLTQVMSETLATSVGAGFIMENGVRADIYAFDNPKSEIGESKKATNFGVTLGYKHDISDRVNLNLGIGYLDNLLAVNDISEIVSDFNNTAHRGAGYTDSVSGGAVYADLATGPFNLGAQYVAALQRFNVNDLPKDVGLQSVGQTGVVPAGATGAKPWAAGLQAGYKFNAMDRDQNVYVGYQASNEAADLFLPKTRVQLGYGLDLVKNTTLGVEWNHDNGYSVARGGNGKSYNLVSLRTAVRFG